MLGMLVILVSVILGGTMGTALIGWLLIRVGRAPKGYAFFGAFLICAALTGWGIAEGGIARWQSLISIFGCAVGAWLNYALAVRGDRLKDDIADFE